MYLKPRRFFVVKKAVKKKLFYGVAVLLMVGKMVVA
jgi:hypothetical protein